MIYTVTTNPSLDKYISFDRLRLGEVNRGREAQFDIGGKGINVSRFLRAFGLDSTIVGFFAGGIGMVLTEALLEDSFTVAAFEAQGQTRINYTIFEQSEGRVSKLNEVGPHIEQQQSAALAAYVDRQARAGDTWVFAGSLAPGLPPDFYAHLIERVNQQEGLAILDCDGQPLRHGIATRPTILHINREEANLVAGERLEDTRQIAKFAQGLSGRGIELVAVSAGPDEAVFVMGGETLSVRPPRVEVKSTVGAGDALVSGLIYGHLNRLPLQETARLAVAAGAAKTELEGTRAFDLQRVVRLQERIKTRRAS